MPWTPEDAHRFTRGLTDRQARRWARVANEALSRCVRRGGAQAPCESSAIRQANSVVSTQHLHQLTVHLQGAPSRYESLDGRRYLVVPAVPIVAGVLNDYLVPAEEIGAYPDAWNDLPLPIGHPTDAYGTPVSATAPAMLEASAGRSYNATMDGPRLCTELWLDVDKCHRLGGDALEVLERCAAGELIELSVAFWSEDELVTGTYQGRRYQGIRRHLRPDHIALLPHGVGACSIADGCGAPRTHGAEACACGACDLETAMERDSAHPVTAAIAAIRDIVRAGSRPADAPAQAPPPHTHLTDSDIRQALHAALARERGMLFGPDLVLALEGNSFVYRDGERLFRRHFQVGADNAISLDDEAEEVQQDTRYVPLGTPPPARPAPDMAAQAQAPPQSAPSDRAAAPATEEASSMEHADRVQALVAHAHTAWTEQDREFLGALSAEQLTRLQQEAETRAQQARREAEAARVQAHQEAGPEPEPEPEPAPDPAPGQAPTPAAAASAPVTLEALGQLIDTKLATLKQELATERDQGERDQLVQALVAHGWTEGDLEGMKMDTLRKLARQTAPAAFEALGLPVLPGGQADDGPSDDPEW